MGVLKITNLTPFSLKGSELGRPGLAHTLRGAWHV
jgi:hypothetical protein